MDRSASTSNGSRGKIGIIGAGISGAGAAWALHRDGFEVHVFEAAACLGGNAKTFLWPDGRRTGLSVLAWPIEYFNNYTALLNQLGIVYESVKLGFHVRGPQGLDFCQGDKDSALHRRFSSEIAQWSRMVHFVRSVNNVFNCCPHRRSLYDLNLFNPLNIVPLRWLSILFGISREFWDVLIVPIYSSTFLTVELDMVPSIILPIISDIIPLDQPATLQSWKTNSSEVFSKMFPKLEKNGPCIFLNSHVCEVKQDHVSSKWKIVTASNEVHHGFDRVVFASSAYNVRECTGALPPCYRNLFMHIQYCHETDPTMHKGLVHSDDSIFPSELIGNGQSGSSKCNILHDAANFISVHRCAGGSLVYRNTFILSSWIPSLRVLSSNTRNMPRLVTYDGLYNCKPRPTADECDSMNIPREPLIHGSVKNDWNHPVLNPVSLACQYLLRYVQGRNGLYFCGSLATPGNGHDLSFLSGLAVAHAMGAKYPFESNPLCKSDFKKLNTLMGLTKEISHRH